MAITKQPNGSVAEILTTVGAGPGGIEYVAIVVPGLIDSGGGVHIKVEGTAADPDGVIVTTAVVEPQTA